MASLRAFSTASRLLKYASSQPLALTPNFPKPISSPLTLRRPTFIITLIRPQPFGTTTPADADHPETEPEPEPESDSDSHYQPVAYNSHIGRMFYGNPLVTTGNCKFLNVKSGDEAVTVRLDMPGVEKEGVKVRFENWILHVWGGTVESAEEEAREYEVKLKLEDAELLKRNEAVAVIRNGVLRIVIPKMKSYEKDKNVINVRVS